MEIKLHLLSLRAEELEVTALPALRLKLSHQESDGALNESYHALEKQIQAFGSDPILTSVFRPLHPKQKFEIPVIATSGIPGPYDAWTGTHRGKHSILFNLSLWNAAKFKKNGPALLLHEVAHVLLKPMLGKEPAEKDYAGQLDYILLNEGIAHFIGSPHPRERLLADHAFRAKAAETYFKEAKELLARDAPDAEKAELVKRSHTGYYWMKFAAIAGMFRAARLYSTRGAPGLIEAIQKKSL